MEYCRKHNLATAQRLWTEETGNSNTFRLGIVLSLDNERVLHGGAQGDHVTCMHLYPVHVDNIGIVVYLDNADSNAERVAKAVANA